MDWLLATDWLGGPKPSKWWDVMGEPRRKTKRISDEDGVGISGPHTMVHFGGSLEQIVERLGRSGEEKGK